MREHLGEQAGERLARRRVAVGEVLERGHVVGAGEQLAGARLAVAAGAADLLRVALQALGQVVVVDVADVGLVDAHAERDRGDDDRLRPSPSTTPAPRRAPRRSCRRGRRAPAGRPPARSAGDALRRPLQGDVDDRRAGRALAQPLGSSRVALAGRDRRRQQRQVGPVEAGDDRVGSAIPKPAQMSATTAGVAVAVSASTRSAPSSRARAASFR